MAHDITTESTQKMYARYISSPSSIAVSLETTAKLTSVDLDNKKSTWRIRFKFYCDSGEYTILPALYNTNTHSYYKQDNINLPFTHVVYNAGTSSERKEKITYQNFYIRRGETHVFEREINRDTTTQQVYVLERAYNYVEYVLSAQAGLVNEVFPFEKVAHGYSQYAEYDVSRQNMDISVPRVELYRPKITFKNNTSALGMDTMTLEYAVQTYYTGTTVKLYRYDYTGTNIASYVLKNTNTSGTEIPSGQVNFGWMKYTGSFTFTTTTNESGQTVPLTPYKEDDFKLEVLCADTSSVEQELSVRTKPNLVSAISCDDITIDEGEEVYIGCMDHDKEEIESRGLTLLDVTLTPQNENYDLTLPFLKVKASSFAVKLDRGNPVPLLYADYPRITGQNAEIGYATITLTSNDARQIIGSSATNATTTLTVNVKRPATDFLIDGRSAVQQIVKGVNHSHKFEITILPEGSTDTEITFESSDTSVATVSSDGVVTAVSTGGNEYAESTITITLQRRNKESLVKTVVVRVVETEPWQWFEPRHSVVIFSPFGEEANVFSVNVCEKVYEDLVIARDIFYSEYGINLNQLPNVDTSQHNGTQYYAMFDIMKNLDDSFAEITEGILDENHEVRSVFSDGSADPDEDVKVYLELYPDAYIPFYPENRNSQKWKHEFTYTEFLARMYSYYQVILMLQEYFYQAGVISE